MKKKTQNRSKTPLFAGSTLIFTAFSQVVLSGNMTALVAASGFFGLLLFGFLVQVVREVIAESEFYEGHDRRIRARA